MTNKHVVVTGASGGIGFATCNLLIENGFKVFGLDKDHIDNIAFPIEKYTPITIDINDSGDLERTLEIIKQETDQLVGLINIAGVFDQFSLAEVPNDRFLNLIKTNFISQQNLTRALFPLLLEGKGRIINLSSETVLSLMPLQSYAFSKKLFEVWNDQLRMELSLLGLKVIKIRAGGHQTPFIGRSKRTLSIVNDDSLFRNLEMKIKENGLNMLNAVHNPPTDVAQCVLKALESKNPKSIYRVNISWLFRILSVIPSGIRKRMMITKLKAWM